MMTTMPSSSFDTNCFRVVLLVLLLAVAVGLSSCTPSANSGFSYSPASGARQGRISVFLNLVEQGDPDIQLSIRSLEILATGGKWQPLNSGPFTVSYKKGSSGQHFLTRSPLTRGRYSRLRITIEEFRLNGSPLPLAVQQTELFLRQGLYVGPGDSRSLFLTWNIRDSIGADGRIHPAISTASDVRHLIADVAYVVCPELDTLFMIRTDKNWVYDSLGVQGEPVSLVPDPGNPQETLYVLSRRKKEISRVSPSANRVVETYPLPMTGDPVHMTISPDGRWGYIADRGRGYILRMDMVSGHIDQRVRVGYAPCYVLYLEKMNLLAVSLGMAQTVVLLDPATLTTVRTISTGNRPEGLALFKDTLLYIAESGANSILVHDLETNRKRSRVPVGYGPRRFLATTGLIYVANHGSRSLSILSPGQLGVTRTISLSGRPLELAEARRNRWIYVGNEEQQGLTIIDPLTSRIAGIIELGGSPGGIAVIN
ncbi:hypothetical protein [Desulfolithobacter sp.]